MDKILLVDDDAELSSLLGEYLQREQFEVHCVYDGEDAVAHINSTDQYGVIVLDIMMPGLNGLDTLQLLRQRMSTPIIMLTGRGDDVDRIVGLEMGADDYLAKPCNPRELLARIRALLRRSTLSGRVTQNPVEVIQYHGIILNAGTREVSVYGQTLPLTGAEFNTLCMLMQSAGSIVSKADLTRRVLHRELTRYDRSMEVHVSRLRKKLESFGASGPRREDASTVREGLRAGGDAKLGSELIKTIRGEGYLFVDNGPEGGVKGED